MDPINMAQQATNKGKLRMQKAAAVADQNNASGQSTPDRLLLRLRRIEDDDSLPMIYRARALSLNAGAAKGTTRQNNCKNEWKRVLHLRNRPVVMDFGPTNHGYWQMYMRQHRSSTENNRVRKMKMQRQVKVTRRPVHSPRGNVSVATRQGYLNDSTEVDLAPSLLVPRSGHDGASVSSVLPPEPRSLRDSTEVDLAPSLLVPRSRHDGASVSSVLPPEPRSLRDSTEVDLAPSLLVPRRRRDGTLVSYVLPPEPRSLRAAVDDNVTVRQRVQRGAKNMVKRTFKRPSTLPLRRQIQQGAALANLPVITSPALVTHPRQSALSTQDRSVAMRNCRRFNITDSELAQSPAEFYTRMSNNLPSNLFGAKPPIIFKPHCHSNDINFDIKKMQVNQLFSKFGLASKKLAMIRCFHAAGNQETPLIKDMEIDLVQFLEEYRNLFHTVFDTADDSKWTALRNALKVDENVPIGHLKNIYSSFLMKFDRLSPQSINELKEEVEEYVQHWENRALDLSSDPFAKQNGMKVGGRRYTIKEPVSIFGVSSVGMRDCITHWKTGTVEEFMQMAEAVEQYYFPGGIKSVENVEDKFWHIVMHSWPNVSVRTASYDTKPHECCGFSTDEGEGQHPWNLKRFARSSMNILSPLGHVKDITATKVSLGMPFSACFWSVENTNLPYVEYLHNGAPKVWYSIPASQSDAFRAAVELICPSAIQKKAIWLKNDEAFIPPGMLLGMGIPVSRHVQFTGEYVFIPPMTFRACFSVGCNISEGVHFATQSWLNYADSTFMKLRKNCVASRIPIIKLLIALIDSNKKDDFILQCVDRSLQCLFEDESEQRRFLGEMNLPFIAYEERSNHTESLQWVNEDMLCAFCECHCYLSVVIGLTEQNTGVCARHGVELLADKNHHEENVSGVICVSIWSSEDMNEILNKVNSQLFTASASRTRPTCKYSPSIDGTTEEG